MADIVEQRKIIDKVQTPCFIIDEDELVQNIENFHKALNSEFQNNILAYSVKTNSLPYILTVARNHRLFAEVVSFNEYRLALRLGYEKNHIIYNGPLKDKATFLDALQNGAYVNLENFTEIEWLSDLPHDREYHIGVRLNIDLTKLNVEKEIDRETSRFGFSDENGEFGKAVSLISERGFSVTGLHVHHTSHSRGLDVYRAIIRYANDVIKKNALTLDYLDIGGGFFGNMPGKPDYIDYVKCISEQLIEKNITVIVEPGNGLIASPVNYVFSVIDTKRINDEIICSTDGSRIDVDPLFHKTSYSYQIISGGTEIEEKQVLTGSTCLEYDRILELNYDKKLRAGDRIEFYCVGAYTMAFTPNFIKLLPIVYAANGGNIKVVRDQWGVDEWIQKSSVDSDKKKAILFTNAGRRGKLMEDFRKSIGSTTTIMASDNWSFAPALYKADKYCLLPKISDSSYIDELLRKCIENNVRAVTSLIDPEISLLSHNQETFKEHDILPLVPSEETADLCFDKYEMYKYLVSCNIPTVETYSNIEDFKAARTEGKIDFPVFIKPRTGSGSVGAEKINDLTELEEKISENKFDYIIQEFMDCEDCDADCYVDAISHDLIAAFSKRKIETRIGGASKTVSFKDEKLFAFILEIVKHFEFSGGIDMDFFYRDGQYYLSEINPRFGGAYLHAFGAGVDFPKYVENNMNGIANVPDIGNYKEGVVMLMYDDVVITDMNHIDKEHLK